MRALTQNEVSYVSGGYDLTDNPFQPDLGLPGQGTSFGDDPASPSSSGGNGSGNNGISPGTAQTVIGVVVASGAFADPASGFEAGHTMDAANQVQQYNQATPKAECEQVQGGTWDAQANNGGGACR